MIVMKFGGSSCANATRLRQVADLVVSARNLRPAVVLSAMGKTTNALFAAAVAAERGDADAALRLAGEPLANAAEAAAELLSGPHLATCKSALQQMQDELQVLLRGVALLRELTPRTRDAIVAHGERFSTTLLAALLRQRGLPTRHVDARTFLRTDDRFGAATPLRAEIAQLARELVAPLLTGGEIVVTQGYVGGTREGHTTTLGRGGSDWSATLLGEAIGAEEVQIWTDVEGVLTADPRFVPAALPIATMSPAEAAELAAFGAKVLHPATIQPAVEARIPVTVRHTQRPEGNFTTIDPRITGHSRGSVAALACRGPVTVLTMTSTRMLNASGYLARLFGAFGQLGISVDLIATAEVSVSCTVEPDAPVEALAAALAGHARVEVATDRTIVVAVGEGLRRLPRLLERACRALGDLTPELVSFGGNERNLSFVVPSADAQQAMQQLHAEFFETAALRDGSAVVASSEIGS
ncbi:MAG: aspartate kinase [Planctomycetes bacterium]|nr:aspartate kinase [Planctomycetota bacterium]MCB9884582.1 aspartate kinase [Planctomycetota bacterium]